MVSTSMNTLHEVDIIYYVIDATVPFGGGESYLIEATKSGHSYFFTLK